MKTVSLCFFKLIFISLMSSQIGAFVICEYGGGFIEPHTINDFSVNEHVPAYCNFVAYVGLELIDMEGSQENTMFESDIKQILDLTNAGKKVYIYLGFLNEKVWSNLLNPENEKTDALNAISESIQTHVKNLKLTGVIFDFKNYYKSESYPDQIKIFITQLKTKMPDLKIGFDLSFLDSLDEIIAFPYNIISSVIDHYFAAVSTLKVNCLQNKSKTGTIITSPNNEELTLSKIATKISELNVEQNKIVVIFRIDPIGPKLKCGSDPSYSEYCENPKAVNSVEWCFDSLSNLKAIGRYLSSKFENIAIDWMEYDDIKNKCGCPKKFPVASSLISGWLNNNENVMECEKSIN